MKKILLAIAILVFALFFLLSFSHEYISKESVVKWLKVPVTILHKGAAAQDSEQDEEEPEQEEGEDDAQEQEAEDESTLGTGTKKKPPMQIDY